MLRLLMATDLSPNSDQALSRALLLASLNGAALRVVHVEDASASSEDLIGVRQRLFERLRADAAPNVQVEVDFLTGSPAECVLADAVLFKPDMIVIGAHDRMRIRDAWLGTTATHLLRGAEAPVLVVRSKDLRPYRRILAAVDDTTAADEVLRLAGHLATATEVFAVHAFHVPYEAYVGHSRPHEDIRVDHERAIEAIVRKVAPSLATIHFETIVEPGDIMSVIGMAAKQVKPDLLLLGTQGRRGLARFLFGSIAESALAYFETDMLIVRTDEGEVLTEW